MFGRTLVLGALALACAALPAAPSRAQEGSLPERRVIVEPGVDFYGGDLRSIMATSLPICRDACLADAACAAFTFNLAASACFLKSDDGARTPFPSALSALLVARPAAELALAADARGGSRFPAAGPAEGGARGRAVGRVSADAGAGAGGRGDARRVARGGEPHRRGGGLGRARGLCGAGGGRRLGPAQRAARARGRGGGERLSAGGRRGGRGRGGAAAGRGAGGGGRRAAGARRAAAVGAAGAGGRDRGGGGAGRGALRLPAARPAGGFRGGESAGVFLLLGEPGVGGRRLRRFRAGRRRRFPGGGARQPALRRGAGAWRAVCGDAARGAAVGGRRDAVRFRRAGGLRARPQPDGAVSRARLRAAEERRRGDPGQLGQRRRGGAEALPGRRAQRRLGAAQRRLRLVAERVRGGAARRGAGGIRLGGDRRGRVGAEPGRGDGDADGRRRRGACAGALRDDGAAAGRRATTTGRRCRRSGSW